jgi:hypothetical protein
LFADIALWPVRGPTYCTLRSGPRVSRYRASELHYALRPPREAKERPDPPQILASSLRGSTAQIRVTLDASAPAPGFDDNAPDMPGGAEAGVAFALKRLFPEGSIVRGAPLIIVGYAVLVSNDKVKLVQIARDGEHREQLKQLSEAKLTPQKGKRALSVSVEASQVKVTLDKETVTLPYQPAAGDADGFVGFIFNGPGHAALSDPHVQLGSR